MTLRNLLVVASLLSCGLLAFGCGPSMPEDTKPAGDVNLHVSGTPQERIEGVQNNPSLTPAEKTQRITAIKERNHLP